MLYKFVVESSLPIYEYLPQSLLHFPAINHMEFLFTYLSLAFICLRCYKNGTFFRMLHIFYCLFYILIIAWHIP